MNVKRSLVFGNGEQNTKRQIEESMAGVSKEP